MLDIRFVLANPDLVRTNAKARYADADVDAVIAHYERLRRARADVSELERQANALNPQFRGASADRQEALRAEGAALREKVAARKSEADAIEAEYLREMLKLPNMAAADVPDGKDDTGNIPISFFGAPPVFGFRPLDHLELCKRLDLVDFEAGARVAGSKFYFLKNQAVLLEYALVRYALDHARAHGFTLMTTPELVRDEIITASGFSPRGPESQIYSIAGSDLSLIGTAEITVGGFLAGKTLTEEELPLRFAALSHCFRTEAGSSGRESRGLYRVHQFTKVELYQFTTPALSGAVHEELLAIEEAFYKGLGLPYRVLRMCKGDLGAPAYRKYDIEAWMPGIGDGGGYGEVTSTSNCTDFQARRLNIKYRRSDTGKAELVHTLNGTAVATTRTMIAILENYQQADGSVSVPDALRPYLGFDSIGRT